MDELGWIWIELMCIPLVIIAPVGLSYVIYDTHSFTGYIEDVSYSQSGFGSTDITVIYFTGRTLIINQNVEINKYCNATIVWRDGVLLNGKQFISISYN